MKKKVRRVARPINSKTNRQITAESYAIFRNDVERWNRQSDVQEVRVKDRT